MQKTDEITSEEKPPPSGSSNVNFNGYKKPNKIGIIFSDVHREDFVTEQQYITEKDAEKEAKLISEYIKKLGINPILFPGNKELSERLRKENLEMVFNLVDSVRGDDSLSSTIPGVLEMLEIPYTGAGILGLSLCYNKFLTKKLLVQSGIPVPHNQLFNSPNDMIDPSLRFPLISKLNEVHGALEITRDSISENEKHLRERLKYLIKIYEQPVLVEEFIVGREVVVIILEGLNKKIYMVEKVFNFKDKNRKYQFASFEDQWLVSGYDEIHYEKYEDKNLTEYIKKAFYITKMADYGKFDIRLDASNRYYFIDSNPNTAFGPKEIECPMAKILDMYNITFEEILKRLIVNTLHPINNIQERNQ